MKKQMVAVTLIVASLLAVFYFLFPGFLFELGQSASRHSAGLENKAVLVDTDRVAYLEGGTGETVLLLHGYTANKDSWVYFAKWLTPAYHVVIPDLPGFGDSTKTLSESYSIESQVNRLDRFTQVLQLKKFHIAGSAMGGAIAAVYAARFSQKIPTLALLTTSGVRTAKKSEFYLKWEKGLNALLVGSRADFERVLEFAYAKSPGMPGAFKNLMVAQCKADRKFIEKIGQDLLKERLTLEPLLPRIQAPALIVWGDHDRMIDISSVPILEKGLKKHQTVILKDTGHVPMMEKPEETATAYVKFLKNRRSM
ncbi:MAG: alpha/beta fold hydrolase [Syntrophobacteraceae bacterium]